MKSPPDIATSRLGCVLRGKYRLERVLGVGGMATVYAATHRNRRRFALKLLHPELSMHAEIRARFQREGYVANSVGHPGAVAVLDDDIAEDGAAFLVMELLDGCSVEELWEAHGHNLPVPAVLAIAEQVLDVLVAAHAAGVVHRDLKPANLFLTREGVVKVLDFGIARVLDGALASVTQSGAALGTPGFMAPEQVFGKSGDVQVQADVWALGATLFTLLSGQFVHDAETTQELMCKLVTTQARSLASVAATLPASVVNLVDRALRLERSERWPDAATMREVLREVQLATLGASHHKEGTRLLSQLGKSGAREGAAPAQGQPTPERGQRGSQRPALWLGSLSLAAALALALAGVWFARVGVDRAPHTPPALGVDAQRPVQPAASAAPVEASGSAVRPAPASLRSRAQPQASTAPMPESRDINPRAAPPVAPHGTPAPSLRRRSAQPTACARLLERSSLGEALSAEEAAFLRQQCRTLAPTP